MQPVSVTKIKTTKNMIRNFDDLLANLFLNFIRSVPPFTGQIKLHSLGMIKSDWQESLIDQKEFLGLLAFKKGAKAPQNTICAKHIQI